MKTKINLLLLFFIGGSALLLQANDSLIVNTTIDELEQMALYQKYTDSLVQTMRYETGTVKLPNGVATIEVPDGFKYLNSDQSEVVLVDLWGNPPSGSDATLGMLFRKDESPMTDSSYAINITYTADGYVKDDDAKGIDYDELLEGMQSEAVGINEQRRLAGYLPIEIVGWATAPRYDAEDKKLYWAQELKFGSDTENTLNYNIRILGRKGYLELNAIGQMYVLDQVSENIQPIIQSVNFNEGYRYADFNSGLDKVAAYGIGGLIAGKVLLKVGFLAKIGILLAKFWKVIALGFIGVSAGAKRFFGKNKT